MSLHLVKVMVQYLASAYEQLTVVFFLFFQELEILLRASAAQNAILFYFTIPKSYFIHYTIPFYNTPVS